MAVLPCLTMRTTTTTHHLVDMTGAQPDHESYMPEDNYQPEDVSPSHESEQPCDEDKGAQPDHESAPEDTYGGASMPEHEENYDSAPSNDYSAPADVSPDTEEKPCDKEGAEADHDSAPSDSGYGDNNDVSPSYDSAPSDSTYDGVSPDSGSAYGASGAGAANGSACSKQGEMTCSGTGFNTCDNGKIVYRACAPGTACRPDAKEQIVCDWPQNVNN